MTKRIALSLLAMLVIMGYSLGAVSAASAHAALTGVDPEPGTTLDEAPQEIVFTFNEVLKEPGFAAVSRDGQELDGWGTKLDGPRLIVTPPTGSTVPGGEYVISFRVVSADGHPIKGSTDFTISGTEADSTPDNSDGDDSKDVNADSEDASSDEAGEPGGIRALLTAPWAWGGIVMVLAIAISALIRGRTAKRNDDTSQ